MGTIENLRRELSAIDGELLGLVKRRLDLAAEIGRAKKNELRQVRDYRREAVVIEHARQTATRLGVAPQLAEELLKLLIRSSLQVQEQDRVALEGEGQGQRALVIGGSGKMGSWFVHFLLSQGFEVDVADPDPPAAKVRAVPRWQDLELDHDLVVIATPLSVSAAVLAELGHAPPPGVVFDIASLKSPLREGLRTLAGTGARLTSIHPMFGPDVRLLSGRHVIFCDVGCPEATETVRSLFKSTLAIQVDMDLDEHDRVIAFVLGLSHAVNLAFLSALTECGESAAELSRISSTTFEAQLDVAGRVSAENPRLYYEIQKLNRFGERSLDALSRSVEAVRTAVRTGDEPGFIRIMEEGHRYVEELLE